MELCICRLEDLCCETSFGGSITLVVALQGMGVYRTEPFTPLYADLWQMTCEPPREDFIYGTFVPLRHGTGALCMFTFFKLAERSEIPQVDGFGAFDVAATCMNVTISIAVRITRACYEHCATQSKSHDFAIMRERAN